MEISAILWDVLGALCALIYLFFGEDLFYFLWKIGLHGEEGGGGEWGGE